MNATIHPRTFGLTTTTASNIFQMVNNLWMGALMTLFGIFSNVVNMIVFTKQGFSTTANISFFSLALSDLLCLLAYECGNVCVNPLMESSSIPFISTEIQYLIGGCLRVCFCRITSWITVYITAERCLSVTLPLKIKQIVSPTKTTALMYTIFIVNLLTIVPEYSIAYYDWKFVPERNITLIGIVYRSFRKEADGLAHMLTTISGMLSFVAVILLTNFLAIKITHKSSWNLHASSKNAQADARSLRDKKTVKMVVVIATTLIVCYTPGAVVAFVTVFEPEFLPSGKYKNIYFDIWLFCFLCSAINSSVNMLLYYSMSTKYRETLHQVLVNCMKSSETKWH